MHQHRVRCVFVLMMLAVCGLAQAQWQTTFDYDQLYEQAQQSIAIGDRDRAAALLERVILLNPSSAGALLDLALLHCEVGDFKQAQERFLELERRFNLPESIQALIAFRRQVGCMAQAQYQFQAHLSTGHVSNVNAAPTSPIVQIGVGPRASFLELSGLNRPRGDRFVALGFQSIGPVPASNGGKWLAFLDSRRYDTQIDHDLTNLVFAYAQPAETRFGPINDTVWSIAYGRVFLGNRGFESSIRFAADAWSSSQRVLSMTGEQSRWGVGTLISNNSYDQDSRFDSLRLEWLARREMLINSRSAALIYLGPVIDWATSNRPGGDRHGMIFGLDVSHVSHAGVSTFGLMAHRINDQQVFNDAFFPGEKRLNRRFFSTVRHEFLLPGIFLGGGQLALFGQIAQEQSIDTISIFSYKNHIVTVGFRSRW